MEAIVVSQPKKSTTVRSSQFPTGFLQTLFKVSFGIGAHLSPAATAGLAQRLFLTPRVPQRKPSPAELRVFETAERFRIPFEDANLAAYAWKTTVPGPTVLLIHGWAGSAGQLHAFVRPLLDAGLSVLAFELPGHGASASRAGEQSNLVRVSRAIRAVTEHVVQSKLLPPVRGIVAHSFGGSATLLSALDAAGLPGVRDIVVIGSPSTPEFSVHEFSAALGVPANVIARMRSRMVETIGFNWSDLELTGRLHSLGQRLLVVHDHDDTDVSFDNGRRLVSAAPGARLLETRGLGHRRILRDASVVRECVDFLAR